jgi:hypothetical protein
MSGGSADPWRRFFLLFSNKEDATSKLKGKERVWGVDQQFVDQKTGKLVPVYNFFCATTEALIAAARKLPPERWNCYEIVREEYPCSLFFDWENHEVDVVLLMEKVKVFIWTVPGLEDVDITYGVKDACDPGKISRHILVWMHRRGHQVLLRSVAHAGALARRIVASFVTEEERARGDPDALSAEVLTFDLGVYTRGRQFRLPGHDKCGKGRPTCPVIDGVKLTPHQTLDVLAEWLVQDPHRAADDIIIVDVEELDGSPAKSSSLSILSYLNRCDAETENFEGMLRERGRRTAAPVARSLAWRPAAAADRQILTPQESLFGTTPEWSAQPMPLDFLGRFPEIMCAAQETTALPSAPQSPLGYLPALHSLAFNRAVMSPLQLDMLARIRLPARPTAEEKAAFDFIGFSTATRKSLAELCAMWVSDLTGDARVTLQLFSEPAGEDTSFMLNCNRTKLCHSKGSEHKANHIYFVINVPKATALQLCRDGTDCGGKPGTCIELPPNLKAAMCLAWHWRALYAKSMGQILAEKVAKSNQKKKQ